MTDEATGVIDAGLLGHTTVIVSSYVQQNHIALGDVSSLIKLIHGALSGLVPVEVSPEPAVEQAPAIAIRKSVTDDYIICLEDGAKLKTLKRYLRSRYDLTPDAYRTKWKLPSDYPMVAPNYAQMRSDMAKRIGLGRKAPVTGRARRRQ